jgi:hypothetical protein
MSGGSAVSVNFTMGGGMGGSGDCKRCVDDPQCIGSPVIGSVPNFLSVCRNAHGVFFLAYALMLAIIIILVWLASNGSVSATVSAATCTFISLLVIILMAVHAGAFVKGIIPECCDSPGCGAPPAEGAGGGGGFQAGFNVNSQGASAR